MLWNFPTHGFLDPTPPPPPPTPLKRVQKYFYITSNCVKLKQHDIPPHYLTQLCCCTICDARTACSKLPLLFFYCTVNSFLTVNSLPTVNSVMHALGKTSPHYLMQLHCCNPFDGQSMCVELYLLFQ